MKWIKRNQGLLVSFLLSLAGVAVWLVVGLQVNTVFAAPAGIGSDLRSRLGVDYSRESEPRLFRMINLAIVREALQDQPDNGDGGAALEQIQAGFNMQVATATALNFAGDPPPTATPTKTPTPTPSNTPEPTATRTPTPSKTPSNTPVSVEPTKTTKPADPTKTPDSSPEDKVAPIVNPENNLVVSPDSGSLVLTESNGTCTFTVSTSNVGVYDPAPSSGLESIRIKYWVEGHTSHLYSDPLTKTCGGFDGSGSWTSCHSGSVKITIQEEWDDPAVVIIWFLAKDNDGNSTYYQGVATYEVTCTGDD